MSLDCLCVIVTFESQNRHADAIVISVLVVDVFSNGPSNQVAPAENDIVAAKPEVIPSPVEFCKPLIFWSPDENKHPIKEVKTSAAQVIEYRNPSPR
jgi:hypothetical protein